VTSPDESQHEWPEEEPTIVLEVARRGRLARIARTFGDTAITIGISRRMTGRSPRSADALVTNSMLFSEGTNKGQDANGRDGD
jgi:trans-2-enoyl-CoA reductase